MRRIGLILFMVSIFGMSALADVRFLPRVREDLSDLLIDDDLLVPVKDASVAYFNRHALERDFDFLVGKTDDEMKAWILRNCAYMSNTQVKFNDGYQSSIPIDVQRFEKIGYRPYGWNRSAVLPVSNSPGKPAGLIDVKGVGLSDQVDPSDIQSKWDAFQQARNLSDFALLDQLRIEGHANGLASLGEAIAEVVRAEALQRSFNHSNLKHKTDYQTVEHYFVIALPFQVLKDKGQQDPAGLIGRQAHHGRIQSPNEIPNSLYIDLFGSKQFDYYRAAVDMGGVFPSDPGLRHLFLTPKQIELLEASLTPSGKALAVSDFDPQVSEVWMKSHEKAREFMQSPWNHHIVLNYLNSMMGQYENQSPPPVVPRSWTDLLEGEHASWYLILRTLTKLQPWSDTTWKEIKDTFKTSHLVQLVEILNSLDLTPDEQSKISAWLLEGLSDPGSDLYSNLFKHPQALSSLLKNLVPLNPQLREKGILLIFDSIKRTAPLNPIEDLIPIEPIGSSFLFKQLISLLQWEPAHESDFTLSDLKHLLSNFEKLPLPDAATCSQAILDLIQIECRFSDQLKPPLLKEAARLVNQDPNQIRALISLLLQSPSSHFQDQVLTVLLMSASNDPEIRAEILATLIQVAHNRAYQSECSLISRMSPQIRAFHANDPETFQKLIQKLEARSLLIRQETHDLLLTANPATLGIHSKFSDALMSAVRSEFLPFQALVVEFLTQWFLPTEPEKRKELATYALQKIKTLSKQPNSKKDPSPIRQWVELLIAIHKTPHPDLEQLNVLLTMATSHKSYSSYAMDILVELNVSEPTIRTPLIQFLHRELKIPPILFFQKAKTRKKVEFTLIYLTLLKANDPVTQKIIKNLLRRDLFIRYFAQEAYLKLFGESVF